MTSGKCPTGYESPRWTQEVPDCSLPMTFDTYSNCAFSCRYCFSQYQRTVGSDARRENYNTKQVKSVNVEKIKRMFTLEQETQFSEYIRERKTLQWGGLSDAFDGFERKYGVTLELLRFFKELDYPISFSTKATWWTKDERYMELFRGQRNWNVKFSIITEDEEAAKKIEVGVPSPGERLAAMERIADAGAGGATLRLRPFIIGVSSKDYEALITDAAVAGASALSTEFFCLERRGIEQVRENYSIISEVAGFDVLDYYIRHSPGQGYLRLNREVKRPYVERMRELCHELGMGFYVSDAHFKECSDGACCCGLPSSWNYARCQFSEALQICRREGRVKFSDIEAEGAAYLQFPWGSAVGYNTNTVSKRVKYDGLTMEDYLRYLWNDPTAGQSPYKMFGGVMKPDGWDGEGNVVYVFDAERSLPPEDGSGTEE